MGGNGNPVAPCDGGDGAQGVGAVDAVAFHALINHPIDDVFILDFERVAIHLGAAAGLAHTAFGLMAAYHHAPVSATPGEIALQFFVFSLFTVPFGAMIGLGAGFLVEGLINRLRPNRPK